MKIMLIYVFITDKVNTSKPQTTKLNHPPIQQTYKRPTAKIQHTSNHVWQ